MLLARDPIAGVDSVNAENERSAQALDRAPGADHGYRDFAFLGDAEHLAGHLAALGRRFAGLRDADVAARRRGSCLRLRRGRRPRPRPTAAAAASRRARWSAPTTRSRSARSTAAEELGLRVPDDLAVTGWDDVMAARHSRPGLTTVRQPMRELGAWAARRLHERLAGDASEPRHEVLPTQLVQRASCGHHPRGGPMRTMHEIEA